jgi:hypothetical protein
MRASLTEESCYHSNSSSGVTAVVVLPLLAVVMSMHFSACSTHTAGSAAAVQCQGCKWYSVAVVLAAVVVVVASLHAAITLLKVLLVLVPAVQICGNSTSGSSSSGSVHQS